jgi:oxygen-independent coproporphyrinogen-3 oxidase
VRFPLGRDGKILSKYVEGLKAEIKAYGQLLSDLDLRVIDVHAGGGTPSLLSGQQWKEILEALTQYFHAEPRIAIEANPDDIANEKHTFDLIEHGVNEVSLGVQSFNPSKLKSLGRIHGAEESLASIRNLRAAGVEYINADMMYMVPNESIDDWKVDLEKISDQDVDEITGYPPW